MAAPCSAFRSVVPLALLTLTALLAACGGDTMRAVAGAAPVTLVRGGAAQHVQPGPIPFGDGDTLSSPADSASQVRIACDPDTDPGSDISGAPRAGLADVTLEANTSLRRRQGSFLDLVQGAAHVTAGPLRRRLVLFHGTVFAEAHETNTSGVTFTARAEGSALTVSVERGELLLHAPGTTPKDLHYVTLGPGETATAEPGSEPKKLEPQKR